MSKPKFIDLFAGAGGFSSGFKKAGFEGVFAVDSWRDAAITHAYNHKEMTMIEKPIQNVEPLKVLRNLGVSKKDIDVIVGGPPCQGFSMAGKRSVGDPRNKLFNEFVRFIDEVEPKFLVMENVKGLLTMKTPNEEKVIDIIEKKFENIGYNVTYKVLNAADYGVPQKRERVIFIANKLGLQNGTLFPKKTNGPDSKGKKPYETVKDAIMDITKVSDPEDKWNHKAMIHNDRVHKRLKMMPPSSDLAHDQSFLPKKLRRAAFAYNCKRLALNEPSVTLIPGHYAFPVHPTLPRTITVREAARLQTFDDSNSFFGKRIAQAQLVGNAVPVKLAEAIGKRFKEFI